MNDAQNEMAPEPNYLGAPIDPIREAISRAQEEVLDNYSYFELEDVAAGELEAFTRSTLTAAGWTCDVLPTFALDVPDESEDAAWYEHATGTIHLHPTMISQPHILNMLARWCRPFVFEVDQFC